MGKQTMGTPCHNWQQQSETKLYRLTTPATPFFRPVHYDKINLDDFAMGTNAIVAVISYTVMICIYLYFHKFLLKFFNSTFMKCYFCSFFCSQQEWNINLKFIIHLFTLFVYTRNILFSAYYYFLLQGLRYGGRDGNKQSIVRAWFCQRYDLQVGIRRFERS